MNSSVPGSEAARQFEFRVIAGKLKGKKILAPDLGATRPPLTRLRKSIFDYLSPFLEDADFLDLFSGTGSYLFEAVSRGVKSATGVELEPRLVQSINQQAGKFGVEDELRCLSRDVFEAVPEMSKSGSLFDIVMIAPPQYKGLIEKTLRSLASHSVTRPGGIIICQHDSLETDKIEFSGFAVDQRRKYGNTTFTILR